MTSVHLLILCHWYRCYSEEYKLYTTTTTNTTYVLTAVLQVMTVQPVPTWFLPARRYASAALVVIVRLSVRLSVRHKSVFY